MTRDLITENNLRALCDEETARAEMWRGRAERAERELLAVGCPQSPTDQTRPGSPAAGSNPAASGPEAADPAGEAAQEKVSGKETCQSCASLEREVGLLREWAVATKEHSINRPGWHMAEDPCEWCDKRDAIVALLGYDPSVAPKP